MPRTGRPPKKPDDIYSARIDLRLLPEEKEAFEAAAELAHLKISQWIRERLKTVARKELRTAGESVPFDEK